MITACRLAVFLGAMLLFTVQPMVGKILLPSFGGLAVVWTTTVLVFQALLLAGYLWAHLLGWLFRPRTGAVIHLAGVVAAAWALPVRAGAPEVLAEGEWLAGQVAVAVAGAVGWPVLVLAATGPLVQSWIAAGDAAARPWRLYALSNAGSLTGLLAYPVLIEPLLGLAQQARWWSVGYVAYAVALIGASRVAPRSTVRTESEAAAANRANPGEDQIARGGWIGWSRISWWLLLAASASGLMLSVSTLLNRDVSGFPLLWVLPLAGYLLSWIVAFDRPEWFRRGVALGVLLASGAAGIVLWHVGTAAPVWLHMVVMPLLCFAGGWVCHGELESSKPPVARLTGFYLVIAAAGLAGSAAAVLLAPRLFTGLFEFHVALAAVLAAGYAGWVKGRGVGLGRAGLGLGKGRSIWSAAGFWLAGILVAGMLVASWWQSGEFARRNGRVFVARGAYGEVEVWDRGDSRFIVNGQTVHGRQRLGPERELMDYYGPHRGVGRAVEGLRLARRGQGLRIGVVGLGAGCMAGWARAGDRIAFYELNPQVIEVAWRWFGWLEDCRGRRALEEPVIVGDARVNLRQGKGRGAGGFDLLVVDAFSGDSIPVHLLTRECLELYRQCLRPGGLVAVHISNRSLDLRPVLRDAGGLAGWSAALFEDAGDRQGLGAAWVVLGETGVLEQTGLARAALPWPDDVPALAWTDDYNSVMWLVDWGQHRRIDGNGRGSGFPEAGRGSAK